MDCTDEIKLELTVENEKEGMYFPVEFRVPDHVEKMDISYSYQRYETDEGENGEIFRKEINIIDLAVCAPQGIYIGSSGSDRSKIHLSAYGSSQGFAPCEITPGIWQIIVGAYKIAPRGCPVEYRITFHKKQLRLYKGDTHIHTTGSDGNCNLEEIGRMAIKEGLDFVFITDHNNYAHNSQLPRMEGLTILPGAEWTHYKGHAGMLGAERPFDNAFCVNTSDEMKEKLKEAKSRGAIRVLNHPFCPNCGWKWGMDSADYDLVEVWNGGTWFAANTACLKWWDEKLKKGERIPITGGSDFHRTEFGRMIGSPCTCLYAWSRTKKDLMEALASGHGFIVYSPEGPMVEAFADECMMGDEITSEQDIVWRFWNLRRGDQIVFISDRGEEVMEVQPYVHEYHCTKRMAGSKYLRAEVRRQTGAAGNMPALVTNPFYLERR